MSLSTEKQRLTMVAVMLLWCGALVAFRMHAAAEKSGSGLIWNLFLAAIPLFFSYAFRWSSARKQSVLAAGCFLLWLLFLPNAPYILTDLIHLAPRNHVPLWFVLAMLLSCAGTGTLLGYHSLLNVQEVIEQRFNQVSGWIVAIGSHLLCGFGIYLGRFLRWNSWDALTKPVDLARSIAEKFVDPGPYPHPLGVTLVFGSGLLVGYMALRALTDAPRKR